jgi:hypothetical protein
LVGRASTLRWDACNIEADIEFAELRSLIIFLQSLQGRCNSRLLGRAIAQAVGRQLPTAAAQVLAQVRSCGIYGGQSGTRSGFLRVLRFPLPVLIPPTAAHSSSSSGAGTIGQLVADVPTGLRLTPPQETDKKNLASVSLRI